MSYRVEKVDFFVNETKPARFASALGKAAQSKSQRIRVTSPICHTRLILKDSTGSSTFSCSADRLSVRWLDKRKGREQSLKRKELCSLIRHAAKLYVDEGEFESPFDMWITQHKRIMAAGRQANQEDLTSSFASALLERALLDGVCRLARKPLFEVLKSGELEVNVGQIHSVLKGQKLPQWLGRQPESKINVRHTVGFFDPLFPEDQKDRLNDGLPETLSDYVREDGIRYFKVKISGDVDADLKRLAAIWDVLPFERQPVVTLDANEAYEDVELFALFLKRLEREHLGLFQHIAYVEQPLRRDLALDPRIAQGIKELSKRKAIIIDESDGSIDAFRRALELGYTGTSHKNCKGVFKSLAHLVLTGTLAEQGKSVVLSAEDLQNLPIVPLQQDFAMVGILGLNHCERNGHHYNRGLSMLSKRDKDQAVKRHPDLYEIRGDEAFLRIQDGAVRCSSLHLEPGFGVVEEPDWDSMVPLDEWLNS